MFKRFSSTYLVVLFLVDVTIVQAAVWLGVRLRFVIPFGQNVEPEWIHRWIYIPNPSMLLAIGLLWTIVFLGFSCYVPRRIIFWFDEFQRITLAHTVAALSLAGLLYLANVELLRLIFFYFYLIALAGLIGYRIALRLWHRMQQNRNNSIARILVVGAGDVGMEIIGEFERQSWPGVEFVGYLDDDDTKQHKKINGLPVLGRINRAFEIIQAEDVDEVIIALPRSAHMTVANLVARLQELPVRLRVVPDYFDLAFHGATMETMGGIPFIGLRDPAIDGFQRFAKRLFDVLFSGVCILLSLPVMLIVALAIKLTDGGSIFYRAPRVGENGKIFNMIKFRSMVINADKMTAQASSVAEDGTVIHKQANDPRITPVGHLIRRTSIDELPQLFNVFRGDMSLVGPRPELPWLVEQYEPWQRKRFAVPQGITGWWQINGRSDNPMHLNTEQDLYYIQHYSLWLDLQILWRTISVVLRGRGAY